MLVPPIQRDVLGIEPTNVLDDIDKLLLVETIPELLIDEAQVLKFEHLLGLSVQKGECCLASLLSEGVALK